MLGIWICQIRLKTDGKKNELSPFMEAIEAGSIKGLLMSISDWLVNLNLLLDFKFIDYCQ